MKKHTTLFLPFKAEASALLLSKTLTLLLAKLARGRASSVATTDATAKMAMTATTKLVRIAPMNRDNDKVKEK